MLSRFYKRLLQLLTFIVYLGCIAALIQVNIVERPQRYLNELKEIAKAVAPSSLKNQLLNVTESVQIRDEFKTERDVLMNALKFYNVRFPRVVLAQSILETGYFDSAIFRGNFNAFGIKRNPHGFSQNLERCPDRNHACYASIRESILDYLIWQRRRLEAYEAKHGPVLSEEQYLTFLDNLVIGKGTYRYAEDPNYTKKLRRLLGNVQVIPYKPQP